MKKTFSILLFSLSLFANIDAQYWKALPNDPLAINYNKGKVVIGDSLTNKPGTYNLYVTGGILTEKVGIAVPNSASWSDYVFEDGYYLAPLVEVEEHIQKNGHLPNVPSAKEVVQNGIDVAKMDATLLRQIEELWLHLIELNEERKVIDAKISECDFLIEVNEEAQEIIKRLQEKNKELLKIIENLQDGK